MARTQGLTLARNNRSLLIIALLAGLAAIAFFVLARSQSDDGGGSSAPAAATVNVVVASQNIGAGTEITAEMLKTVEVPQNLLVSNAYTDSGLAVGQVTAVAVSSGEQITPAKLGSPGRDLNALSSVVRHSMRGSSAGVQELTAVGGLILPGDHVDVVATYKIKNLPGLGEKEYIQRTEVILQNVEVLSVAQEAQDPKPLPKAGTEDAVDSGLTSGQLPEDVEEQPQAGTVTVTLDPQQTLKLLSYQDNPAVVRIWTTLRGFGDTDIVDYVPYDVLVVE